MEKEKLYREEMAALSEAMHQVFCALESAHVEKDKLDILRIRVREEKKKEEESLSAVQELHDRKKNLEPTDETLQELSNLIDLEQTKWATILLARQALEREFLIQSILPASIPKLESLQKQLISDYRKRGKICDEIRKRLMSFGF